MPSTKIWYSERTMKQNDESNIAGPRTSTSSTPDEEMQSLLQEVTDLKKRFSTMDGAHKKSARRLKKTVSRLEVELQDLKSNNGGSTTKTVGNNEKTEVRSFPQNTFSFLLLAKYPICDNSRPFEELDEDSTRDVRLGRFGCTMNHGSRDYLCFPFWLSCVVLGLQMGIYSLALENAADFDSVQNPFNFPINVDPYTRATAFLALLVTVYTENNVFEGVELLVQGYDSVKDASGITRWKYYISALSHVIVGCFSIFVTFVIVMQADEVVDLLLNFTAMSFVGAMDDVAFALCLGGFFGLANKKTAIIVKEERYVAKDERKWIRKWPLIIVLLALLVANILVWANQNNRAYGDNQVYVQFSDNARPWLATLSGSFFGCTISGSEASELAQGSITSVGNVIYTEYPVDQCADNWKQARAAFFFCQGEHWVFAVGEEQMRDPCNTWTIESFKPSPRTADAYDIMTHSTELWFTKTTKGESTIADSIQFAESFVPFEPPGANCKIMSSQGVVFSSPYYEGIKNFEVNYRPVFYAADEKDDGELIIYNGRRWLVLGQKDLFAICGIECVPDEASNECMARCLQEVDLYSDDYKVRFISDPMDVRTSSDTWIPTNELRWYTAKNHGSESVPDIRATNLAVEVDRIPALLETIRSGTATKEEEKEATELFAQSATFNCLSKDNSESQGVTDCLDGESSFWIDLITDSQAQDTFFLVTEKSEWDSLQTQPASDVKDIGYQTLDDSEFFQWDKVKSPSSYQNQTEYRYTSCIPQNTCGILYFEDVSGDGISFPGRFEVFVGGKRMKKDKNVKPSEVRHCVYQFGTDCKEQMTCSNQPL